MNKLDRDKNITEDKNNRSVSVIKTTVANLDLQHVLPQRAGIIMYTSVDGAIYFGLGLDSRTHDLTDFGGRIYYPSDKDVVQGALREFREETLDIFETIKREDIMKCPVIYDDNNLIIFVHINIDPNLVCKVFNLKYEQTISSCENAVGRKNKRYPEVCGITWLSWEEFQHSINSKDIMFSRVRKFLTRANDFSYLL